VSGSGGLPNALIYEVEREGKSSSIEKEGEGRWRAGSSRNKTTDDEEDRLLGKRRNPGLTNTKVFYFKRKDNASRPAKTGSRSRKDSETGKRGKHIEGKTWEGNWQKNQNFRKSEGQAKCVFWDSLGKKIKQGRERGGEGGKIRQGSSSLLFTGGKEVVYFVSKHNIGESENSPNKNLKGENTGGRGGN